MLSLVLALTLFSTEPHSRQASTVQTACPTEATPELFLHKAHIERLRLGATAKVGGCMICHDRPETDHGCRSRLHPGFNCRSCHLRIPGADVAH
jgi:hypothetical protein